MAQLDSHTLAGILQARTTSVSLAVDEKLFTADWRQGFEVVNPELGGAGSRLPPPLVYRGPEALLYQAKRIRRDGKDGREAIPCALKISQNPENNKRLVEEAKRQDWLSTRAAGDVVAPVLAIGEHKGRAFFVTPWYALTLGRWLAERQPDLRARLSMLIAVSRMVRGLHGILEEDRQVVHGDLKPGNIALLENGHRLTPLLIDMGTTRATTQVTQGPEDRFVSPGYAPPNQAIPGFPTLCSDDAFAVAAILFAALLGHAPKCSALEFRSYALQTDLWTKLNKPHDVNLFFNLRTFRSLLEIDLAELREQAIDDATALGAAHVAEELADGLASLVRAGLEPDPAQRSPDWLSDAEKALFGLLELLRRPPPPPEPEPAPERVIERVIEYVPLPPRPRWPAALAGLGVGVGLGFLLARVVDLSRGDGAPELVAAAVEPAPVVEAAPAELAPTADATPDTPPSPEPKEAEPPPALPDPTPAKAQPDPKPAPALPDPTPAKAQPDPKPAPERSKAPALVYPDGEAPLGKLSDAFTGDKIDSFTAPGGITFSKLRGGEFTKGSPASDTVAASDEKPQYRARVEGFSIAQTETTQAQWDAVLEAAKKRTDLSEQVRAELALLDAVKPYFTGPERPMDSVSWCDALRFADVLSAIDGKTPFFTVPATCEQDGKVSRNRGATGYRLPTEVEWEYAARGGQRTRYYNGDDAANVPGWIQGSGGTKDVKGKGANAFGLYDVHGNVWEWTLDAWDSTAYAARGDGVITSARLASYAVVGEKLTTTYTYSSGAGRVLRGGSWVNSPGWARAASRYSGSAGDRSSGVGFRLVLPPQS